MSGKEETADIQEVKRPDGLGGRPAAGEDPVKREQILDGAHRVFMEQGFAATSMNDITREAGVSKGTLYVYFKDKEHLFAAIIQRKKAIIFGQLAVILAIDKPVAETLYDFGLTFTTHILSDFAIRGQRTVIGVIERMPDLACNFFATGPSSGPMLIANYLENQVKLGNLKPIEDAVMTSRQFSDLCLAGLYRQRLFGEMVDPPPEAVIERNVSSAVRLFLNTYGVERTPARVAEPA